MHKPMVTGVEWKEKREQMKMDSNAVRNLSWMKNYCPVLSVSIIRSIGVTGNQLAPLKSSYKEKKEQLKNTS